MSSSTDDKDKDMDSMGRPVKKFLFDRNDFDRKHAVEEKPTFSEEQLELARTQALEKGRIEGQKTTQAAQEQQIISLLEKCLVQFSFLVAAEEKRALEKYIDTVRLTMKIAHKLMPHFAQKYALAEIERVILDAADGRREEARIAVIVPTVHLDALKERVDRIAIEKGFSGKIILLADDAMGATDCRVEWADGGAERFYERLYADIEGELTKAIAGIEAAIEENKQQ